jgi:hypothetical protein
LGGREVAQGYADIEEAAIEAWRTRVAGRRVGVAEHVSNGLNHS